eukprot:Pgem_evm1s19567
MANDAAPMGLDLKFLVSPRILRTYAAEFLGMFFFLFVTIGTINSCYSQNTAYL